MLLLKHLIFLLLLPAFCYSQSSILFVGNSITYVNDLPAVFDTIARANARSIYIKSVAYPGFSLKNHLNSVLKQTHNPDFMWRERLSATDTTLPEAVRTLKQRQWEYIYLQDRQSGEDSIEYALKQIRKMAPDSRIMLFGNYVYQTPESPKNEARRNLKNAKQLEKLCSLIDATLIPANTVFLEIKRSFPDEVLFDDTMHPTAFGTRIIALLLYTRMYGESGQPVNRHTLAMTDRQWLIVCSTFGYK